MGDTSDVAELLNRVRAELKGPARRATYRLQLGPSLGFDGVAEVGAVPGRARDQPRVPLAVLQGEPGQRAWLRRHRPQHVQPGARQRRGLRPAWPLPWPDFGMGVLLDVVPNHMGDRRRHQPPGGWTCWRTARARPTRASSTSTGAPSRPSCAARCCSPCSPTSTARRWSPSGSAWSCVEGRLRHPVRGGAPARGARRRTRWCSSHRLDGLAEPSRRGRARTSRSYSSILTAIEHLPPRTVTEADRIAERLREKEIIKRRLAALVKEAGRGPAAVEDDVRAAQRQSRRSARASTGSTRLLDAQAYRLAYWRVAVDEINYRRFFDINDLAAIRMERPEVFEATHALVLRLLGEGKVHGLRIDHPDGLYAPASTSGGCRTSALRAIARPRSAPGSPGEAGAGRAPDRAAATPDALPAGPLYDRGREDPRRPSEQLPDWLGGGRHDRLRFPRLGQRAVRGPRRPRGS